MRLYIDPGTGSMLFSLIIGLATTCVFLGKGLFLKLKQKIAGGKVDVNDSKIPYVIFSDHKRYWNIFRPICEEFERRGIFCEYWTMSPDDPALCAAFSYVKCIFIGEGSKAFARLNLMNAHICLSTTPGLDVLQWKRSKGTDYYVHIHHTLDDGTVYRMFALDHYDAVLMNGTVQEFPARELERMRHLPEKDLILVGSPFMDELKKRADALPENTVTNKESKTILCAPSWGESSILNKYGSDFLDSLIATGYNIVIRPHPQSFSADAELMEKLQKQYPENERFHWNRDNDNFKALSEADLMISDFSGVIFDYSLTFDRPIIYTDTQFDKSPYDAAWFEELPYTVRCLDTIGRKLSPEDFADMKRIIDDAADDRRFSEGRAKAKELLWAYPGESAHRIVDYLMACEARFSEKK